MSIAAGAKIGSYEILSILGAGGMGEVYRARDSRLNRDVAIKVLPDSFSGDPDASPVLKEKPGPLNSWGREQLGSHLHNPFSSSPQAGRILARQLKLT